MFCEFRSKILAAEKELAANRQDNTTPDVPAQSIIKKSPKSNKYDSDIEALKKNIEEFKTGCCIEIDLQNLLTILPKKRARCEAFNGLVSHLQKNYNITLTIKSRRTK